MSVLSRSKLHSRLRDFDTSRFKAANIGGDQEAGFEQSFASLAHAYIADKAPGLLDFMVGFQLVDRNEDNTKAIGIFGFQLDKEWLYAPVFFLNGDLKGHELLYLKGQDKFVPMKENWVNYLIGKRPHILGESTPESFEQLGVLEPDLHNLSIPPQSGKFASYRLPKMQPWAKQVMPNFASWATQNPGRLEKYAGLDDRLDLANTLGSDIRLENCVWDTAAKRAIVRWKRR